MARPEPPEPPDLPPGLAQLFEIVLTAAAARRSLRPDELAIFRAAGADASRQGHGLGAVIDAYLRGAGELWEQVLAGPEPSGAPPLLERGRTLRRVSEDAVAALAQGYEEARRRSIRAEEAQRRAVIEDLLAGTGDSTELRGRARRFGLLVPERAVVAVARSSGPPDVRAGAGPGAEPVEQRLERVVRSGLGPPSLVTAHQGLLVAVVPESRRPLLEGLAVLLERTGTGPWRVALGREHRGSVAVARSFAEARAALELATRLERPETVISWDELLPYRVLTADPAGMTELVARYLQPLETARRGSLVPTLAAHVEHGGNLAAMARALSLSPRAVAYRLERIEALTGLSLRDPHGRFVLELALRGAPLAGPV
jgi:hypothetical protein